MRLAGRSLLVLTISAVGLAGAFAPALAAKSFPAAPVNSGGWRTVTAVSGGGFADLADIAVTSPDTAWAVGQAFSPRPAVPLVERWNGAAWHRVALPRALQNNGVPSDLLTAVSERGDFWAFGIFGQWLHWNGTWAHGTLGFSTLDASAMFGPKDVWAFGGTGTGKGLPLAFHYTGSAGWTKVAVPGSTAISAVSAISRKDIWAVLGTLKTGQKAGKGGGLVHWDGNRWRTVRSLPARLANASLGAVLARSDRNVWVGGAVHNGRGGTTEAVGHWNGYRWTVTVLPVRASSARYNLDGIVADGSGGLWAAGQCWTCRAHPSRLWHETAGRWSGPKLPRLSGHPWLIRSLTSTGHSVWAAGGTLYTSPNRGLIALWGPRP